MNKTRTKRTFLHQRLFEPVADGIPRLRAGAACLRSGATDVMRSAGKGWERRWERGDSEDQGSGVLGYVQLSSFEWDLRLA